ncbi:RidA family protein, partial [Streptomyces sp. NPDC002130]
MSRSVTSAASTDSASDRLQALGLALPELSDNPYYVHHRAVGSSIYISGQLPYQDGWLQGQGTVGREVELA